MPDRAGMLCRCPVARTFAARAVPAHLSTSFPPSHIANPPSSPATPPHCLLDLPGLRASPMACDAAARRGLWALGAINAVLLLVLATRHPHSPPQAISDQAELLGVRPPVQCRILARRAPHAALRCAFAGLNWSQGGRRGATRASLMPRPTTQGDHHLPRALGPARATAVRAPLPAA